MAEKKSPIHISIFARLSIMGTTATLWRTHLTIHLDVSTQNTVSSRGCSNVMPLSNQLSIDFCAVSKAYHGVKGSQNVILLGSDAVFADLSLLAPRQSCDDFSFAGGV